MHIFTPLVNLFLSLLSSISLLTVESSRVNNNPPPPSSSSNKPQVVPEPYRTTESVTRTALLALETLWPPPPPSTTRDTIWPPPSTTQHTLWPPPQSTEPAPLWPPPTSAAGHNLPVPTNTKPKVSTCTLPKEFPAKVETTCKLGKALAGLQICYQWCPGTPEEKRTRIQCINGKLIVPPPGFIQKC